MVQLKDDATLVADYYENYVLDVWLGERTVPPSPELRDRIAYSTDHAREKGRVPAHPARLADGEWGVRISYVSGGEDLAVGDEVEVQVISKDGRTWPNVALVERVMLGHAFGRIQRTEPQQ